MRAHKSALPAVSDLPKLAQQINEAHRQAEGSFGAALMHAQRAGDLLTQAKRLAPHGTWRQWLKANCTVSERTAQNYMRIARKLPAMLAANPQRAADLSIREAVRRLSAPQGAQPGELAPGRLPSQDEFERDVSEWRMLARGCRQVLADAHAPLEEVAQVQQIAGRWQARFAEHVTRFERELGKLLGLLADDIVCSAAVQIVLRRDYPDVAKLLGLPA